MTVFAGQAFAAADAVKASAASTQQDPKKSSKSEMIDIVIPAEMAVTFDFSDESLVENDEFSSIVKNDDGSYTISVTKEQHKELMAELKTQVDTAMEELVKDSDYAIESIEPNEDYTEFTVDIGNRTSLSLMQSLSVLYFYTYGGMYDLFNGGDMDNIHVDFVNSKGDVVESADSGELTSFFSGLGALYNGGSGEETEESADVKDIEVLKEYTLPDSFGLYTQHFYVVQNKGDATLDILTSTLAYDAKGNPVGVGKSSYEALPPGQTAILCESIETGEEIASYEPTFRVKKSSYDPVLQDLSVKRSDVSRGVILQITNDGEVDADFVRATALFFKDGELVDSTDHYFINEKSTMAPGETIIEQLKTFKKYDSIEVYFSGGKHYNW